MIDLPYLASLANAQTSVLARHAYEHEAQHNVADKAMLLDDITNARRTLDKMERVLLAEDAFRAATIAQPSQTSHTPEHRPQRAARTQQEVLL